MEEGVSDLRTGSVPALDQALNILEILTQSRKGMSLAEISRQTALPKSSAHRIVVTLERRGYLHRNSRTGRYLFGLKLLALSNMALSGLRLRELAAPFLRALMESTRLTVHMAILDRNEAVLIEKLDPTGTSRIATWIGRRMDLHCTGIGKALIAYLPDKELDRLIQDSGLPRHNDNTISSPKKLRREIEQIRVQGYAVDDEEDEVGFRCVACPVFRESGRATVGISVVGTTERITAANVPDLANQVRRAASLISRDVGRESHQVWRDLTIAETVQPVEW